MKKANFALLPAFFLLSFYGMGCSKKQDDTPGGDTIRKGTLYYSAADELTRYDFESKKRTTIFSDGDHYRISPDARRFIWYKNNFASVTTRVQVHNLSNPSEYEQITVPYILEQTPWFIPGANNLYAALAKAEDGAIKRKDLLLFDTDGKSAGRIPHIKDFAILPNGKDLVISAEALNTHGESIGFALAIIKNFLSANEEESITICEYPDYNQLPENIAVSPDGSQIVFTQSDHLYTVDILAAAVPKQITKSRFRETDAAWSKDGQYIVFTANTSGWQDCGEIRIIPARPENPITIPEDGVNNEPADPLQPVDIKGKAIHACGSESYVWL